MEPSEDIVTFWRFLKVAQRTSWSARRFLRITFLALRVSISEAWRSTVAKSSLFSILTEWSFCSTLLRRCSTMLTDLAKWSWSRHRGATRSTWTSFVPEEPCACYDWDVRPETAKADGGDWTSGECRSCAASRGDTIFWADDRLTVLAPDRKGVRNKVRYVSGQLCPRAKPRVWALPPRRTRAQPRIVAELRSGRISLEKLIVLRIIDSVDENVSVSKKDGYE